MNTNRRLTRSSTDRMLGGVCGGLARYLGVDPTLVRIGFVLLTLSGVSPLAYLVLWVVIPSEGAATASWTQQVQQSIGEMQSRARAVAAQVSSQVQRIAGDARTPAPPASGTTMSTPSAAEAQEGPSIGPTTKL